MQFYRLKMMLLAMLMASLTSCGRETSSATLRNPCDAIPLAEYTRAQQLEIVDEMDPAVYIKEWPNFIVDYAKLRAAVRACQGVK